MLRRSTPVFNNCFKQIAVMGTTSLIDMMLCEQGLKWLISLLLHPPTHVSPCSTSGQQRAPCSRHSKPGWSDPSLFSSATHTQTQTEPTLPSTANTQYFTWCVVPSISTGTMKSALLIGWRENTEREMVGELAHMSRAVYIHMALHNNWTRRSRPELLP